jgi:uncharacterized membrane protein YqjE
VVARNNDQFWGGRRWSAIGAVVFLVLGLALATVMFALAVASNLQHHGDPEGSPAWLPRTATVGMAVFAVLTVIFGVWASVRGAGRDAGYRLLLVARDCSPATAMLSVLAFWMVSQ